MWGLQLTLVLDFGKYCFLAITGSNLPYFTLGTKLFSFFCSNWKWFHNVIVVSIYHRCTSWYTFWGDSEIKINFFKDIVLYLVPIIALKRAQKKKKFAKWTIWLFSEIQKYIPFAVRFFLMPGKHSFIKGLSCRPAGRARAFRKINELEKEGVWNTPSFSKSFIRAFPTRAARVGPRGRA
jgi:hypothetical protein